ncbi:hypothetical protein [Streptomyces sp. NPDC002790]|uniref:hypothetical protein n=1 Tax=Streptomyces sp. NPDC002790 TaxID=3154431 RepID=UPI00332B5828
MRLGRALATGIAEETPRTTERPERPERTERTEVDGNARELTPETAVRAEAVPEPAEVPAAR